MQDVSTETSGTNDNGSTFIFSHSTGQFEEFQCLFQRDSFHTLLTRHLCKQGFVLVVGTSNLYNGSEAAYLDEYGLAALGVDTQLSFTGLSLLTGVHRLLHNRFEVLIERLHHVGPLFFTFSYLIKVLFHFGGEVIVHNGGEILHEEVVHHNTDIRRQQLSLVGTGHLLAMALLDLLAL